MARERLQRRASAGGRMRRLSIEALEDRRMLTVITVTTELDNIDLRDGKISLREAVFAANAVQGVNTIRFDPSLAGVPVVLTMGELEITGDVIIEGLGAALSTIDASGSDPTPDENNGDG